MELSPLCKEPEGIYLVLMDQQLLEQEGLFSCVKDIFFHLTKGEITPVIEFLLP